MTDSAKNSSPPEANSSLQNVEVLFEELGITNQQFRILFNDFPEGIALYKTIFDRNESPADFMPIQVNKAYERIVVNWKEMFARKISPNFSQTEGEPLDWKETYCNVENTGVAAHFEARFDSNKNWFLVYVYRVKKGFLVSMFADITQYKSETSLELKKRSIVEQNLRANLEKYRYLLQYAPTGIYEVDYNGPNGPKFNCVNDAMCQTLGYTEQELLAMNPSDLLYSESRKILEERTARILKGKKIDDTVMYHVKTKDGRGIWANLNVKIISNDGKPESALVVAYDVTERKRAENKFLYTEKRYRRLYETTQDGIMARNLEGKMIDCNQAYAKMLGYTKKELRGLTVQHLLPEKWHDQRERVVNKVLQAGRSIVFEREYKRKDGTIFPASVRTWRLTDGKGDAVGIWSIVRDISDQKELQKKLEEYATVLETIVEERTKKLKDNERLAAIGQTAGMVGHDLRNPLQTVIGELYLAKGEVESLSEGDVKSNLQESIRVIEDQAVYMDKIVSDLQAFVRPVKIEKKPINLKELVDSVLSSVTIPANIALKKQTQRNLTEIHADPQLLKRVLINLVTNAVQAMPDGGKLTLRSQAISTGEVSVTVEDTGVGIPEKIKPQIFTPLFTTKPRGQGFGLAVCKRVIEAHGGEISFESKEGEGTKFTIKFSMC